MYDEEKYALIAEDKPKIMDNNIYDIYKIIISEISKLDLEGKYSYIYMILEI